MRTSFTGWANQPASPRNTFSVQSTTYFSTRSTNRVSWKIMTRSGTRASWPATAVKVAETGSGYRGCPATAVYSLPPPAAGSPVTVYMPAASAVAMAAMDPSVPVTRTFAPGTGWPLSFFTMPWAEARGPGMDRFKAAGSPLSTGTPRAASRRVSLPSSGPMPLSRQMRSTS